MSTHGGHRNGAGRKPKAEELALIEQLSPYDKEAMEQLVAGMKSGEFQYLKLFMEYRYGKPKESLDLKSKNTLIHRIIVEDVDGTPI